MGAALLNLFLVIILFGVVLGIINAYIPMARAIKSLLNMFAIVVLMIYILQYFGLISNFLPIIHIVKF